MYTCFSPENVQIYVKVFKIETFFKVMHQLITSCLPDLGQLKIDCVNL